MFDNTELTKDFIDISKEQNRGILKKIVKAGNPSLKPYHKDTCTVRYVGTYFGGDEDGKEFDRSDKFDFQLGVKNVITAWDVCVATMHIGEVCELIASPENCYNDGKSMKFEIEVFSTSGEDISENHDGSVRKSIIEEGDGLVNPSYGVEAKISYKILGEEKTNEVSFVTGDPEEASVPAALDKAVRSMTQHEVAKIAVKETGKADSSKVYEVKLISFEKLKHLSTFPNFEEQMNHADSIKDRANHYLKSGKFFLAIKTYERLMNDLEYLVTSGPEEQKKLNEVKIAVHNNSALAYLKMKDASNAMSECGKSLSLDFKNEKALFRYGQAYLLGNDHEEALSYFKKCAHFHQGNTDALKMKTFCESNIAKAKANEKARFRGIFNKLKDTGLGLPDEPEPEGLEDEPEILDERGSCSSCASDEEEEQAAELVKETA